MGRNDSGQSENLFNLEIIRRLTLQWWPGNFKSRDRMARAGFYYNFKNDQLKCKFCEIVIGDWAIGDDPFIEHRIHSPYCPLITQQQTDNVPISHKTFNHELRLLIYNRNVRHPEFENIVVRVESFQNWPKHLRQRPDELSEAGFFYLNEADQVKCFSCGGCLENWMETDDPFREHYNLFGDCKFIRRKLGVVEKSILLMQAWHL